MLWNLDLLFFRIFTYVFYFFGASFRDKKVKKRSAKKVKNGGKYSKKTKNNPVNPNSMAFFDSGIFKNNARII